MSEKPKSNEDLDAITNAAVHELSDAPGEIERGLLANKMRDEITADNAISNGKIAIKKFVEHEQNKLRRSVNEGDNNELESHFNKLAEAQQRAFDELDANAERYRQIEALVNTRSQSEIWKSTIDDVAIGSSEFSLSEVIGFEEDMMAHLETAILDADKLVVPAYLESQKKECVRSLLDTAEKVRTMIDASRATFSSKIGEISKNAEDVDVSEPSFWDVVHLEVDLTYLRNLETDAMPLFDNDPLNVEIRGALEAVEPVYRQVLEAFDSGSSLELQKALATCLRYKKNFDQATSYMRKVNANPDAPVEEKNKAWGWLMGAHQRFEETIDELRPLLNNQEKTALELLKPPSLEDIRTLSPFGNSEHPQEKKVEDQDTEVDGQGGEGEEEASGEESGDKGVEQKKSQNEEPAAKTPTGPVARKPVVKADAPAADTAPAEETAPTPATEEPVGDAVPKEVASVVETAASPEAPQGRMDIVGKMLANKPNNSQQLELVQKYAPQIKALPEDKFQRLMNLVSGPTNPSIELALGMLRGNSGTSLEVAQPVARRKEKTETAANPETAPSKPKSVPKGVPKEIRKALSHLPTAPQRFLMERYIDDIGAVVGKQGGLNAETQKLLATAGVHITTQPSGTILAKYKHPGTDITITKTFNLRRAQDQEALSSPKATVVAKTDEYKKKGEIEDGG